MATRKPQGGAFRKKKEEDPNSAAKRAQSSLSILLLLFLAGFIYILIHTFRVQMNKEEYIALALRQWTTDASIDPKRGEIRDRNGLTLARSGQAKTVVVQPHDIGSDIEVERVAKTLSEVLSLNYQSVYEKVSNEDLVQRTIKRQITEDEFNKIVLEYLPGVSFITESRRSYAQDSLAAQLIGFTNLDGHGQTGLEFQYEDYLAGTQGRIITQSDPQGSEVSFSAEQYIPAQDGCDLTLSIDVTTQALLDDAMQDLHAASNAQYVQALLMDVKTGDLLAVSNVPGFDLNNPPRSDMQELNDLQRNRAVSDEYSPGKLMGPLIVSIAMERNLINEEELFFCEGSEAFFGEKVTCPEAHGEQNIAQVLQSGCKVNISRIVEMIDVNDLYNSMEILGIGQTLDSGIRGESSGTFPHKKYAYPGSLTKIATGESIKTSSLQLATAYAALANGGTALQPQILQTVNAADGTILVENKTNERGEAFSSLNANGSLQLLKAIVEEDETKMLYLPGYAIAGMTDISYGKDSVTNLTVPRVTSVSIAPADSPRYVLVISVENPRIVKESFGKHITEPYARKVLYDRMLQMNIRPVVEEGEDITIQSSNIAVPDLRGMTQSEYKEALEAVGLKALPNSTGVVNKQSPEAGTLVPMNSSVLLYMSGGSTAALELPGEESEAMVTVPQLTGKTVAYAFNLLEELGLKLEVNGNPNDRILSQDVSPGKKVPSGTIITVSLKNSLVKENSSANRSANESSAAEIDVPEESE